MHLPLELSKEVISSGGGIHGLGIRGSLHSVQEQEGTQADVGGAMCVQRLAILPEVTDHLGMYAF